MKDLILSGMRAFVNVARSSLSIEREHMFLLVTCLLLLPLFSPPFSASWSDDFHPGIYMVRALQPERIEETKLFFAILLCPRLAQLVRHASGIQDVLGSIPIGLMYLPGQKLAAHQLEISRGSPRAALSRDC
eukprot:TRINITY_DN19251_c0_g1_i3.p1 TRINITY_DN19251_c0_g1~~TRINITY_DN19251_c0_g1_i3.p1  ORF type:complete len:132 (-),score=5.90 TRINITY_DN19251_c0_g1_i3:224-619(-)